MGSFIVNIRDVLAFFVLFGFTIFIHELGHFLVALRLGMVVDTFSIGFGPAIWKRTVRGITYKVGWIPFGGYVALPQLDPSGMALVQGKEEGGGKAPATEPAKAAGKEPVESRVLPAISPWKKMLVSLAGCVGNLLFAIVLAWAVYLAMDVKPEGGGTQVGFVDTNSVAYALGIRAGDEIVEVNGKPVASWYDYSVECQLVAGQTNEVALTVRSGAGSRVVAVPVTDSRFDIKSVDGVEKTMLCTVMDVVPGSVAEAAGLRPKDLIRRFGDDPVAGSQHFTQLVAEWGERPAAVSIERAGEPLTLTMTPIYNEEYGKVMVGVSVSSAETGVMPWMQYRNPWDQIRGDAMGIVRILKALVTPKESKQAAKGLGGPVMIFMALWAAIKVSWLNAVGFVRFLNVNLAILNLLPIPVLDGGHMLFSLWEGLTRRRPHPKVVNALVNIFAVLLIAALLALTYRDVIRLPEFLRGMRGAPEVESVTNEVPTEIEVPVAGEAEP